ncbi:MAG: hypothetical protein IKX42_09755 [Fibrobacter sp.]|nr:hypothetical protein [Fibrobacter sp.]
MLNLDYKFKLAFEHPFKRIWKILQVYFSLLGGLYTICQIASLKFDSFDKAIFSCYWTWIVCLLVAVCLNIKWFLSFTEKISAKDTEITLKVGKIEREEGALAISTNSAFVTTMQSSVISEGSAQGAFQKRYFDGNPNLDVLIKNSLNDEKPVDSLILKIDGKKYDVYEIGTMAKIVFDANRHAYLFALNDINENGQNVQHNIDVVYKSIQKLWDGILKKGHTEPELSIHLVGSGRAGISEATKMESYKIILESFLACVVNSGSKITDHLNIVVHPKDLSKIDLAEAAEFLKYKCKYFSSVRQSQNGPGGTPAS